MLLIIGKSTASAMLGLICLGLMIEAAAVARIKWELRHG